MRVAAIDIGTNSVLLLVAELRGLGDDAALVPLVERATITRLGKGVDQTRALAPEAIERTLACLADYADEIRKRACDRVDVVGTSAMRDARGGEAFASRAAALLGVTPRVISGEEEAGLTFEGALTGLDLGASAGASTAVTVFDVGGGSTEIIAGSADGVVRSATSLDVGSVRLTERHLRRDPPSDDELQAVRADVRRALTSTDVPTRGSSTGGAVRWVGVAGTVTTLAALVHDVAPYDGARVHGARVSTGELAGMTERLAALPLAARQSLPALEPARADVIVAGALVVQEVLAAGRATEFIASDRGVRWGLARRLAEA